jgi:hypothetical protein
MIYEPNNFRKEGSRLQAIECRAEEWKVLKEWYVGKGDDRKREGFLL